VPQPKNVKVTPPTPKQINRCKTKKTKFEVTGDDIEPDAELIAERKAGKPGDRWSGLLKKNGPKWTAEIEIKIGGKACKGKPKPDKAGTETIDFTVQNPDSNDPASSVYPIAEMAVVEE
jgi:hypothetical protein